MKTLLSIATIIATLAAGNTLASTKPPIVLVHGAWETASVWDSVEAKLKHDGYQVTVVTLPGRPGSPADPGTLSLDTYRDTVLHSLLGESRPVVLVGHSF